MILRDEQTLSGHIDIFRFLGEDSLELFSGQNVTYDYPDHIHEDYCVVLILKGKEITSYRGQDHTSGPGSLLLFDIDETHSSRSIKTDYRIFKIRPETVNFIGREVLVDHASFSFPTLQIADAGLFRELLRLHIMPGEVSSLEFESGFLSALATLITRHGNQANVREPARREARYANRVRDYLREHYDRDVSLADLTAHTNLSPFYLLRIFQREVGLTPHQYQTQVRIARARKLIRKGCPISQAALETGFYDQSHFTRTFKRIVGTSPGRYF